MEDEDGGDAVEAEIENEEDDRELEMMILDLINDWGYRGVTREIFYKAMPGIGYDTLKKMLADLEERGLIKMEWLDLDRFEAYITGTGLEYLKSPPSEDELVAERMVARTFIRCNICLGSIKEGMDMIKCSCGKEYHRTCGERFGKCPDCDVVFSEEN